MTKPNRLTPIKMLIVLAVAVIAVAFGYILSGTPYSTEGTQARWISFGIGLALIYAVYVITARNPIWTIGPKEMLFAVFGACLYGLLLRFGNTSPIFEVPSASQVSLRPGIVVPIVFGYIFGPVTGLLTGLVCNVIGDVLSRYYVTPQWDFANGLIGFVAGLSPLILAARRQQTTWIVLGVSIVLSVLSSLNLHVQPVHTEPVYL